MKENKKEKEVRKVIFFDLDTNKLKKHLGKSYTIAYQQIKESLLKNGFRHIQGSVYETKKEVSYAKVVTELVRILDKYPYLKSCIRDIKVSNISKQYDLNYLLNNDGIPKEKPQSKKERLKYDDFDIER